MRKIYFILFIISFSRSVWAGCSSVAYATKCAKIPDYFGPGLSRPGTYTSNSWDFIFYDYFFDRELCYWSGDYATIDTNKRIISCHITSPFQATLLVYVDVIESTNAYEACAKYLRYGFVYSEMLNINKLPGDECPDGFYTVPYDIHCGQGFVDTTDIPSCSKDTTGEFCVMQHVIPCASGIGELKTSGGIKIPLWAEKYTTPAMHVLYNGVMCYGNLSPGREGNTINVQIDNQVYHLVK